MTMRLFLILIAIAIASVFGQTPAPVKAGDLAPNLTWTRILVGGQPGTFIGRVTVIGFFPAVSPNESLVSRWNELVAKFAGQPVHFVWIASEYQPPLDPWLEKHPVSGCLLLDPLGATAQAYGVEFGGVIVNTDGHIAGFTFALPAEKQIKAVQEGSAIAIKGDANDSQMDAILAGRAVRLDSEPHRMRVPESKPDIPPSLEVRISPSKTNGTEETQGPDWWVQRGFDLKAVIAKAYEEDPRRIVLPEALQNEERSDFVLRPSARNGRASDAPSAPAGHRTKLQSLGGCRKQASGRLRDVRYRGQDSPRPPCPLAQSSFLGRAILTETFGRSNSSRSELIECRVRARPLLKHASGRSLPAGQSRSRFGRQPRSLVGGVEPTVGGHPADFLR
jgi:hypothetical protein